MAERIRVSSAEVIICIVLALVAGIVFFAGVIAG